MSSLSGDCIFSMDKFRRASPSARLWWNLSFFEPTDRNSSGIPTPLLEGARTFSSDIDSSRFQFFSPDAALAETLQTIESPHRFPSRTPIDMHSNSNDDFGNFLYFSAIPAKFRGLVPVETFRRSQLPKNTNKNTKKSIASVRARIFLYHPLSSYIILRHPMLPYVQYRLSSCNSPRIVYYSVWIPYFEPNPSPRDSRRGRRSPETARKKYICTIPTGPEI